MSSSPPPKGSSNDGKNTTRPSPEDRGGGTESGRMFAVETPWGACYTSNRGPMAEATEATDAARNADAAATEKASDGHASNLQSAVPCKPGAVPELAPAAEPNALAPPTSIKEGDASKKTKGSKRSKGNAQRRRYQTAVPRSPGAAMELTPATEPEPGGLQEEFGGSISVGQPHHRPYQREEEGEGEDAGFVGLAEDESEHSSTLSERSGVRASVVESERDAPGAYRVSPEDGGVGMQVGVIVGGEEDEDESLASTQSRGTISDDGGTHESAGGGRESVGGVPIPAFLVSPASADSEDETEARAQRALRRMQDEAPLVEGEAVVLDSRRKPHQGFGWFRRNRVIVLSVLFLIVCGSVVIPIAVSRTKPKDDTDSTTAADSNVLAPSTAPSTFPSTVPTADPSNSPSALPTAEPSGAPSSDRFVSIKNVLSPVVPHAELLSDPTSPQHRALAWLADDDMREISPGEDGVDAVVQRYALAAIYFGTGGIFWIDQLNFLSPKHECDWNVPYDVPTTDVFFSTRNGAWCSSVDPKIVSNLYLYKNNLTSSIPDELSLLTSVWRLALHENHLIGTLPDWIGYHPELTFLCICVNDISGTIPSSLGDSSSLELLYLGYNHLTGTVPSELNKIEYLYEIQLTSNNLNGTFPLFDGRLTDMDKYWLGGNSFTGTIATSIQSLVYIDTLDLHGNFFSGVLPSVIGGLEHLQHLDLGSNGFVGRIPTSFANLSKLEYMDLSQNQISGSIPSSFAALLQLEHMNVGFNAITGIIPQELGELSKLTELWLNSNRLNGTVPDSFSQLLSLKFLAIDDNDITGAISAPCALSSITTLRADCLGSEPEVLCGCCNWCCDKSGEGCTPREVTLFTERFHGIKLLIEGVSKKEDLENDTMPQYTALNWLAKGDPAWLDLNETDRLLQRYALATMFFSTGGLDLWFSSLEFLTGQHECNWNDGYSGAFCIADPGVVDEIILGFNELSGTLPAELRLLSSLVRIDLFYNNLQGELPASLADLAEIEHLHLKHNSLHGNIDALCNRTFVSLDFDSSITCSCCDVNCSGSDGVCMIPVPESERLLSIRGVLESFSSKQDLFNEEKPQFQAARWLADEDRAVIAPNDIGKLVQRYALAMVYFALDGIHSWGGGSHGFLSHHDECDWNGESSNFLSPQQGAFCEAGGSYITVIQIREWKDVDSYRYIPSEIMILKNLTSLIICCGDLAGTIPEELGELRQLSELILSQNKLTKSIPTTLGNCQKLSHLSLYDNALTGSVPLELGDLINLEYLILSNNEMTGTIPLTFLNLTRLSQLSLAENNFKGSIDFLCNSQASLSADCLGLDPEVRCGCCSSCCNNYQCCNDFDSCFNIPCIDTVANWVDAAGDSCDDYASPLNNDWCLEYGDSFEMNGLTANDNCCACGGGQWQGDTCFFTEDSSLHHCECHESCETCGYGKNPTSAWNCLACMDGSAVNEVWGDGTGYCGELSSGYAIGGNEACFVAPGVGIVGCECHVSCLTCGFREDPTSELDCLACADISELVLVEGDDSGYCGGECKDTDLSWVDVDDNGCADYADNNWCLDFGDCCEQEGMTANDNCCVCGGGSRGGDTCFFTQDSSLHNCDCHETCHTCGYGTNPTSAWSCITCMDGSAVHDVWGDGTGYCGELSDDYTTDGSASCFIAPGIGIVGCTCHESCGTCGYRHHPITDLNCISCADSSDVVSLWEDGTGACSCTDVDPSWTDSSGDSCADYAAGIDWCAEYGDCCEQDGMTANDACCICGGGTMG